MGKKSKKNRNKIKKKAIFASTKKGVDDTFKIVAGRLRELFADYTADDVIISLIISDLWLPNISSQVKHVLGYSVAIAMDESNYIGSVKIESYAVFVEFIKKVYEILPGFPLLEDYVPEKDWGEVKQFSDGFFRRIYYGGSVERISDFITGFNLIYGKDSQAIKDMNVALLVQDHILNSIDKSITGEAEHIENGHIEIPGEKFWLACRNTVIGISEWNDLALASPRLIAKLGGAQLPKRRADFEESLVVGAGLSILFVEVGQRLYPIAIRNSASTVIQFWENTKKIAPHESIADFVKARFSDVIGGPLNIVTRTELQPTIYSAFILGKNKSYLLITLARDEISQLRGIENDLIRAVESGNWALRRVGDSGATQIRSSEGLTLNIEQLSVIAVIGSITTVSNSITLPKTNVRVLFLADFISIFDSIEDIVELDRYWSFNDANALKFMPFIGAVDRFAAFRDSYAILADGAVDPTSIMLDPHWGSNWRYRILNEFWDNSPPLFPDIPNTMWTTERDSSGLYTLKAKNAPILISCTVLDNCVINFMLVVREDQIKIEDGRILELLVHCLADTINQRRLILSGIELFNYRQIITECQANIDSLTTKEYDINFNKPLLSNWRIAVNDGEKSIRAIVQADLKYVQKYITNAVDASFEVDALVTWLTGVASNIDHAISPDLLIKLWDTSEKPPRFVLKMEERKIDVPDYSQPYEITPENLKSARRELAIIFKEIGADVGRYDLDTAKPLIDLARDNYRALIHSKISKLNRHSLIKYCIEQQEELLVNYNRECKLTKISLGHEVEYDRSNRLAEAHTNFIRGSRNYRYLIECCYSMQESGNDEVSLELVAQLIASIDWLLVLYNASDVLHNGIDAAGLELDHHFVPDVYYSSLSDQKESEFAYETAEMKLGFGVNVDDAVQAIGPNDPEWSALNEAFLNDVGITFDELLDGIEVFCRWPSLSGRDDLQFYYSSPIDAVLDILMKSINNLSKVKAQNIISFFSLDKTRIKRLLGKTTDESDVPVWEHNKRGDRYTIKPIIEIEEGLLAWGAGSVNTAGTIWHQTITNGYMPAAFEWPNIIAAVQPIKSRLEAQLEVKTKNVLLRATPFTEKGINFSYRFPEVSFPDVGDFDALAYWPENNQWLIAECKYNQPAFCFKDARRLRDRIFGTPQERQQFGKIEKRREFFISNIELIRQKLGWPEPKGGIKPKLHEIYISRSIYWWMRNQPYSVPTKFIRVDMLENWLKETGLLK